MSIRVGTILNVTIENNWINFSILSDSDVLKRSLPLDATGYKFLLLDLKNLFGEKKAERLIQDEDGLIEECKGQRIEFTTKDTARGLRVEQLVGLV